MPYRSWQFRIDDIIEAINKIERYTHGIESFEKLNRFRIMTFL
jgi:uncharacterized protein with HEPN domain